MKNAFFRFKQFQIDHSKSAMKIGTDGVLLGAWTSVNCKPKTILDIGSGTGLIALMLAQRTASSIIKAIEIENNNNTKDNSNECCVTMDDLERIFAQIKDYHMNLLATMKIETVRIARSPLPFFAKPH